MRASSVIQFEIQNGITTNMKWVIVASIAGVVAVIGLIIGFIFILLHCRKKKRTSGYRDISSEDGTIKASSSVPVLHLKCAENLTDLMRSRSLGNSPLHGSDGAAEYPQPNLSRKSSGHHDSDSGSSLSLTDQYSPFQRSFHVENFPYLEFSTLRDKDALTVVVLSLHNIPDNVRSCSEYSEGGFFVKAYLLPDEICLQTKVYRPTGAVSQECNECLQFDNVRENTGLLLSAYFIDQRRVRMSLGHTTAATAIEGGGERVYRTRLEQLSQALHSNIGELELTLAFLPDKSRLKVDVHSFKDLTLVDVRPTSAIILRIQLLHGRKVIKEKEIQLTKLERNPRINEGCVFSLTQKRADISHLTFLLTELIHESEDENDTTERCIGRVDIGPYLYARGEGLMHWQGITTKPNTSVFMSHSLEAPLFES